VDTLGNRNVARRPYRHRRVYLGIPDFPLGTVFRSSSILKLANPDRLDTGALDTDVVGVKHCGCGPLHPSQPVGGTRESLLEPIIGAGL